MSAIQFIKENGVEKAREVVDGAPDKTASHYVISKRPHYYSVDFQSYFNNGDWYDSDYTSEQDLVNDYEPQNVIRISDLKRIIKSVKLVEVCGGLVEAKKKMNSESLRSATIEHVLYKAISDYEAIFGGEHV
ncbi:MAG: hypothetical protein RR282_00715 [Acinetobacter sp.]